MSNNNALLDQLAYGGQHDGKVAVIDIGSNSVRLVIYDGMKRIPLPIYNEKAFCTLGKGIGQTQRLNPEGVKMARQAMGRLLATARINRVSELHIIATAAVRDADDGKAFVKELERTHKIKIKVISGKKEAEYAALGIVSGHFQPVGLVADLGGGSLELTSLNQQDILAHDTQPLGALRLLDRAGDKPQLLQELIDRYLDEVEWLTMNTGTYPTLYAVGGSFRALAKCYMDKIAYPIDLLNDYCPTVDEISPLLHDITGYNADQLATLPVSSKRQPQLPVAAKVMLALIKRSGAKRILFSANGIREGLLFNHLSPYLRREDPLLASCDRLRMSFSGQARYARELFQWMKPILLAESPEMTRIRIAACMLNHLALTIQRPNRARWVYHHLLQCSIQGATHAERVALATALYHRYQPAWKNETPRSLSLIDAKWRAWAALVGATMRMGYHLSGGAPGNLVQTQLRLEKDRPKLRLSASIKPLAGETLDKRLAAVEQAYIEFMSITG